MADDKKSSINLSAEIFGGGGLGLLVGILMGLSVSETVGTTITALLAILSTFLGLKGDSGGDTPDGALARFLNTPIQAVRLGSFSVVCVVGILWGVHIRANNLMGASIPEQVQSLKDAGYSDDEAHALVAFREFGVKPEGAEITEDAVQKHKAASSVLFSIESKSCAKLDPELFKNDPEKILRAWRLEGGRVKEIADSLESTVPQDQLLSQLKSVWEASCRGK